MLPFEWIACGYFAALAAAAPWTAVTGRRRAGVTCGSSAIAAAVLLGAPHAHADFRAWIPHLYLVLGYWLPALLVRAPGSATRFERWLVRTDNALRPRLPSVPARLMPIVDIGYLLCYPLVPAAFLVVWTMGGVQDVSRFWVAVLASGYACYGSLPWLVSRPPRLVADARRRSPLSRTGVVNAFVLSRLSHQLNTFPSGHVAVSCAAAVMVMGVSVAAGTVLALVAWAIAIGAAAGRYHYIVDVIVGVAMSALVLTMIR